MDMFHYFLLIALLCLTTVRTEEEQFENGTIICSKCDCTKSSDNKTHFIDCTDRQLKHIVSDWPEQTDNIVATFSRNEIRTLQTFPGSDSKLKLVFDYCNIEILATGLFESSLKVVYLDLSHNKLTSDVLSADVFKGPYNATSYEPIALEYLNLAYNDIHSLHQNIFEHTPNLKYLSLEGNNFRVLDDTTAVAFKSIPLLKIFNLANNGLMDLSENILRNFRGLSELDISNNDFDFVPTSLGTQTSLEVLKIDNNPILLLDDEAFLGMENILEVSARNLSKLELIKTNTFAQVKKLKRLDLSQNEMLSKIDEQAFLQSEKLRDLNLSNTKLLSLPPTMLNWSQLHVLDLSNNQLYCDCNLYNITQQLNEDIRRDKNGPYCRDVRTSFSLEIYTLTNDICTNKIYVPDNTPKQYTGSKLFRISLVLLTIVLVVAAFIAAMLGYAKWRAWQRNQGYPFASQIVYNPITTNVHF